MCSLCRYDNMLLSWRLMSTIVFVHPQIWEVAHYAPHVLLLNRFSCHHHIVSCNIWRSYVLYFCNKSNWIPFLIRHHFHRCLFCDYERWRFCSLCRFSTFGVPFLDKRVRGVLRRRSRSFASQELQITLQLLSTSYEEEPACTMFCRFRRQHFLVECIFSETLTHAHVYFLRDQEEEKGGSHIFLNGLQYFVQRKSFEACSRRREASWIFQPAPTVPHQEPERLEPTLVLIFLNLSSRRHFQS